MARSFQLLALGLLAVATAAGTVPDAPAVPPFTTDGVLDPRWKLFTFGGIAPTLYEPATDGALAARADSGAALLYTHVDIDPRRHPVVRWRWLVDAPLAGGDITRRATDDAAARVYVAFRYSPELVGPWQQLRYDLAKLRYGEHPPYASLTYTWANRLPVGTVRPSPLLERSVHVVLRSGADDAGTWQHEERNIVEDFREVFGFDPPHVSHLAVMSDADDTGGTARARFADLDLHAAEAHARQK